MESRSAARHSSGASPSGSAAASRISRCVASGNPATRSRTAPRAEPGDRARPTGQNPGSLRSAHPLRQLQQAPADCPPVSAMIRSRTRSSSRPGHGSRQQRTRIRFIEAFERQLRQTVERAGGDRLAQREHHRHRLRRAGAVRRIRALAPMRRRATARHPPGTGAGAPRRSQQSRLSTATATRNVSGRHRPTRARRRLAARSAAVLRGPRARRASARTTDGSRRTAAPSPPGRLRPRRRARPTPAARRIAAARSFRCPARRGSPGRRSDHRGPERACRRGVDARLSGRGIRALGWQASDDSRKEFEVSADGTPSPPVEEREHRVRRGPADRDAALAQLPCDSSAARVQLAETLTIAPLSLT